MSLSNYNLMDVILILTLLIVLILSAFLVNIGQINKQLENKIRAERKILKKRVRRLKRVDSELEGYEHQLKGKDSEKVMREIEKISGLWKSRREKLYQGYWRAVEEKPDELEKLQKKMERINELIKQTKIKYHKREIDEESFREIVKEYQKELMELNLKVNEMKGS